ncbi:MAG TPA: sulfatase-like hydrolase/transferase [Opitutaceae bacterium]
MSPRLTPGLLLLSLVLAAASALAAPARKPNFLFVYTDDQRYDAMGVVQREQGDKARFPWFTTPHMDRLAAEGLRFRNAFVTLSLCAPSRAAFMTGRDNHLNGVANNQVPFPEDSVTHATAIKSAGYTTAYIGKWHMGGQRGKRAGFDYSASFIGQGVYFNCPIEIDGKTRPTTGWIDDVTTDYAIEFIKKHRDRPFSVTLGYKASHGPFSPPERAQNRFADAKASPVPNLASRAIYRGGAADTSSGKGSALVTEKGETKLNLGYFRCISAADDNLGRLLDALDALGLAEDTVVIYSSDNGYYHGEHGLGDKRSAYDESLRIPLLVRYPRMIAKGTTSDALVLNIDLAPTLVELAGAATPASMQGKSWRPLFTAPAAAFREAFFAEYFWEANFPTTPTLTAVRTQTAKLIKYDGKPEWTELFDLAADPYETKNLFNDPQHRALRIRLEAEYEKQAKAVGYVIPSYAHKPGETPTKQKKKKKA